LDSSKMAASSVMTPSVLPVQMIARIHTAVVPVRRMIHGLLIRIGRHHPQAGPSFTEQRTWYTEGNPVICATAAVFCTAAGAGCLHSLKEPEVLMRSADVAVADGRRLV
jgi:hypothetical protein